MAKFANKPRGKPTKRKTLKTKYKIERKVKQHKKRVRKEARKLKGQGLKHKGIAHSDYLPNMFPFKQQMLEEAKRALPKEILAEVTTLDQSSYGLTNIENKCAYLPKPKDNLIKKYVNNL
jgi:nuclear GTP-binding protein